jgi:hypothetical protein
VKEFLKENNLPLNRFAKKALERLRVKPDDQFLYSLQLMQWGLSQARGSEPAEGDRQDLLAAVEKLNNLSPDKAMKLMQENPEDGGRSLKLPNLSKLPPQDLANSLLVNLRQTLAALPQP